MFFQSWDSGKSNRPEAKTIEKEKIQSGSINKQKGMIMTLQELLISFFHFKLGGNPTDMICRTQFLNH